MHVVTSVTKVTQSHFSLSPSFPPSLSLSLPSSSPSPSLPPSPSSSPSLHPLPLLPSPSLSPSSSPSLHPLPLLPSPSLSLFLSLPSSSPSPSLPPCRRWCRWRGKRSRRRQLKRPKPSSLRRSQRPCSEAPRLGRACGHRVCASCTPQR